MTCVENKMIPEEIRRIINNAYHIPHPFRGAYLTEMMSIFARLRKLDQTQFIECLKAIEHRITDEPCEHCRGKGLAYLKLLTVGLLSDYHDRYSKLYDHHVFSLTDNERDYEREVVLNNAEEHNEFLSKFGKLLYLKK